MLQSSVPCPPHRTRAAEVPSTSAIPSTHSGPKSVQHTTKPIPITAIRESLKPLHLPPARTVGERSCGQRKGGLAGLSLGWRWISSMPKADHTWGSSDLPDRSGIRTRAMWGRASNPPLPDYWFAFHIFSSFAPWSTALALSVPDN